MERKYFSLLFSVLLFTACQSVPVGNAEPAIHAPASERRSLRIQNATAPVVVREEQQTIAVDDENCVFFNLASTELSLEERNKLARHVAKLKADDKLVVTLVGHSDDQGSRSYNLAIADRRADNVFRFLRAAGVPAMQIRRFPLGSEKLGAASCTSSECRSRMRRVDLIYS